MRFHQWLDRQIRESRMDRTTAAYWFRVSRQTLHNWLKGTVFPSMSNLRLIGRRLSEWNDIPVEGIMDEIAQSVKMELLE